jgi:hypothetical protein
MTVTIDLYFVDPGLAEVFGLSGSESFHWHRLDFHKNLIILHYRCHVVSLFMEESHHCVRLLHQLRAEGLLVSTTLLLFVQNCL